MKKKILISVIICLVAAIVGITIGLLKKPLSNQTQPIENSTPISYFADEASTEKFTILLPEEHSGKIFTVIDEPIKGVSRYTFKHVNSGEILFVISISKNDTYKSLTYPYSLLKETETHTYLWSDANTQSVKISDEAVAKEFADIIKYIPAIKENFSVNKTPDDEKSVVSVSKNEKGE